MNARFLPLLLVLQVLFLTGCYSLKGITIDPRVNTFSVSTFETIAGNAPPTLGVDFSERLKDKMRSETRLQLKSTDADLERVKDLLFESTFAVVVGAYNEELTAPVMVIPQLSSCYNRWQHKLSHT